MARLGLALALVLVLAACGDGTAPSSATGTSEPPPVSTAEEGEALPPPVAATRDAIVDAAHAADYRVLRELTAHEGFSYSFGETGDAVGYWRRLERDAHVPILGDIIPLVLATEHARRDDQFVWPAAFAKDPAEWTAEDVETIEQLNGEGAAEDFRSFGGYVGWRAGIREDGTWLFFVSGD